MSQLKRSEEKIREGWMKELRKERGDNVNENQGN
jgi:hypothetical protein